SAGDMAFQDKARRRMRDMMSRAKIMVVVSHDLGSLVNLCEKGVWLDRGRVRLTGPMPEVVAAYKTHVRGYPCPPEEVVPPKGPELAPADPAAPGDRSAPVGFAEPQACAAGR